MRIIRWWLPLLVSLCVSASTALAQSQIDVWYVDVVSGSDTNAGSETAPFKSIDKALSEAGVQTNADIIRIAPGVYSEANSSEQFGTLGYLLPRSTMFEFWDIDEDLPGVVPDPVVIETTSSAGRAFRFNETGPSGSSGCLFAKSATGHSLPVHLLEFRGFEDVAVLIDRGAAPNSAAAGDEFVGTGIDFIDCASAVEIDTFLVKRGFHAELRNCNVELPTASAVSAGIDGATQAIEARAHDGGALSLKLDRVEILASDRVHGSSLVTVEALKQNDQSGVQPPVLVEIESCRIGTAVGATGVHIEGAGLEVLSRVKGAGELVFRNSDFINCRGDGVIVGALGGQKTGEEFYLSTWTVDVRYSTFTTGGLNSSSSAPILGSSSTEFSGSGIHCWVIEAGRIPDFYAFKTVAVNSGRHGIYLESDGQLDFPVGYPDVDLISCLLGENGGAAQTVGEMGHGLDCRLSDDTIDLEVAGTLFRGNASSGMKVHLGKDQLGTPVPGVILATNCIFTGNLGYFPSGKAAPFGAPIHLLCDDSDRPFELQMAFLTVSNNPGSIYSLALHNDGDAEDEDTLESGSIIENSIFRENGGGSGDLSFFPEPSATNDLWPVMFSATHYCDLNEGAYSSYYSSTQGNFYLDPKLVQATIQGVNVGVTVPNSSASSPVIDAGRIPGVSGTVSIDARGGSRPLDYPGLGGTEVYDVGAFELDSSNGE
jgi:Protein of unknown function (DUF1565)